MDLKDKVTVWAGLLTLAVLQVQALVDTELKSLRLRLVWRSRNDSLLCNWLRGSVWSPQMDP